MVRANTWGHRAVKIASGRENALPRDAAGSFELLEGTGEITGMVSCGEFLEIYKRDKTYRVTTPDTVDPERVNANAPWLVSPVSDVGSAHPVVARLFIQSVEMLGAGMFRRLEDTLPAIKHLHACKETMVECDSLATAIVGEIDTLVNEIENFGLLRDRSGRGFNPFPAVDGLEGDCSAFLTKVNRVIRQISGFPYLLLELDRADSNFDHLGKHLSSLLGASTPFPSYVMEESARVRYLAELRNYDEHPGEKRTRIKNLHVLPNGDLQTPTISLEGGDDTAEYSLRSVLVNVVPYLLSVAEAVVIHSVLNGFSSGLPFVVQPIPDPEVDPSKPVRYRLTADLSALNDEEG